MRKIKRREVLASTVAISAAGLAGCISDGGGDSGNGGNGDENGGNSNDDGEAGSGSQGTDDGSQGTDDGSQGTDDGSGQNSDGEQGSDDSSGDSEQNSDDGSDDSGQDSDDGSSDVDAEITIETLGANCASGEEGSVDIEFGEEVITVTGNTPAPNPCHEAIVESSTVENGSFTLVVDVRSTLDEGEACQQCTGAIQYEAQIRSENASNITQGTVDHVQGGTHGVGVSRDSDEGSSDGPGSDETGSSSVTDSSIQTIDASCRTGEPGVTLSEHDGGYGIDGLMTTSNPCHRATLSSVGVENQALVVEIGAESTLSEGEMCQSCVGGVEYEADVELTDPDSLEAVEVTHPSGEQYTLDPTEAQ